MKRIRNNFYSCYTSAAMITPNRRKLDFLHTNIYNMSKNMKKISVSSKILFGKPRIKGTRISVEQVLGCLSEGWTHKKIQKEFSISNEDILACIDFAYHSVSRTHFLNSGQTYA